MLMSGMGMLHLEVKQHRLERDFRLKVRVSQAARQLPRDAEEGGQDRRRMRQASGDDGAVREGDGRVRADRACEQGVIVVNQMSRRKRCRRSFDARGGAGDSLRLAIGRAWAIPVIDVKATLRAGADARDRFQRHRLSGGRAPTPSTGRCKGNMMLLEPVMRMEVTMPEEYLGPVTADMNARRAEIREVLIARQAARDRGAGAAGEDVRLFRQGAQPDARPGELDDGAERRTPPVDAETRRQMESGEW